MKMESPGTVAKRMKQRLHQTEGVIDLASIMVGVIIVGILSAGIVATTFALVPFTQDKAAQQALGSVQTAQGAAYVVSQPSSYLSMDDLVEGEWVQSSESVSVSTNADASCFIAMSVSPTGAKFWTDSSTAEIARFVPGTSESDCADIDELASGLGSEDNSGGSGITDGAMSWPGWGTVNMMKSSDDGTSADLRIFVDTMNASKSASEPSTSFTNLPFLQTDAATPTSGFTASITDAHILVNGQDIVVETGATITGYMDSPNLVHQLEFPSIRVPVDALPAMWSDWDGGTLMFKVDGVQQGLVMSTADWQDGAP